MTGNFCDSRSFYFFYRRNLVVVPMQDYLELKNKEGRMNTPSVAEGNWNWRLKKSYRSEKLANKINTLLTKTKRI